MGASWSTPPKAFEVTSLPPIIIRSLRDAGRRRKRFFRSLALMSTAILVGTTLLGGSAATAQPTAIAAPSAPSVGVSTSITGAASGRCLDTVGRSTASRTPLVIDDCDPGAATQQWTLSAKGQLTTKAGALCLDVRGRSTQNGAIAQVYPCHSGDNQKWTFAADGTLVGTQSGRCLDVRGAATAKGSDLILWTCHGKGNQQWTAGSAPGTGGSADTTPPSIPSAPVASALTCSTVTLAWNASTDNVAVTGYDVYHDGQFMKAVSGSTLSTSLDVVPGVPWGLYVNARDAAGNISQASTTVTVTPPQCSVDATPPTAPTGLTAVANGTSVSLTWTAATDDVGVRSYDVYRGSTKVGSVAGTSDTTPATTFIDSGLPAGTALTYSVEAKDAQNNVSPRSATATVTTGAQCDSPVCGVETVTTDTDIPWGLTTLPDGDVLYSRRDAHDLIRLDPETGTKVNLGTVPNVESTDGEGGLLGVAISPDFATDGWVYLMHTSPTDNRIVRIKLVGGSLDSSTEQVLLTGILRNKYHNGGRLRFGPDGTLYASTGDAQNGDYAQDTNSLNGKILRMNADGSVPSDNPFGNLVFSYGHRNPQGIAFDSKGRLWEQEFGNSVMDETNLIVKGGNYGWPACEGTSGTCSTPGFIAPKQTYRTADASCSGLTVVRDVVYIACGRGQRLYRWEIVGDTLANRGVYFEGTYGRLRTVEPAPDGGIWITTTTKGDKDSIANNSDEKVLHVALGG